MRKILNSRYKKDRDVIHMWEKMGVPFQWGHARHNSWNDYDDSVSSVMFDRPETGKTFSYRLKIHAPEDP